MIQVYKNATQFNRSFLLAALLVLLLTWRAYPDIIVRTSEDLKNLNTSIEVQDELRKQLNEVVTIVVTIEEGVYELDHTIVIPGNIRITGKGQSCTEIKASTNLKDPMIKNQQHGKSGNIIDSNIIIEEITFTGNCLEIPCHPACYDCDPFIIASWGYCGDSCDPIITVANLTLRNLTFKSVIEQAVWVVGDGVVVSNCDVSDVAGDGIQLSGRNISVSNTIASYCGDCGIEISRAEYVTVSNCIFFKNSYSGLNIRDSYNVTVSDCSSNNNGIDNTGRNCKNHLIDHGEWNNIDNPNSKPGCENVPEIGTGFGFVVWAPRGDFSHDIFINGCSAKGNSKAGIACLAEGCGRIQSIYITSNIINHSNKGISLTSKKIGTEEERVQIHDVFIERNRIRYQAVRITSTDLTELPPLSETVEPTLICENTENIGGIAVAGADRVSVSHNTIIGKVGTNIVRTHDVNKSVRCFVGFGYYEDPNYIDRQHNWLCNNYFKDCIPYPEGINAEVCEAE